MESKEFKFDYTNNSEEITEALFEYIGYDREDNKEQFDNVEYGLYQLLCAAENPHNFNFYRELYSSLDEFVEVYKERKFHR